MLRITLHDGASELRFQLEGRLAGPWVQEVELCWQTALSTVRGRRVLFDLRNVDYVDDEGERLLKRLAQHGAKLNACGPMMGHLVAEITGEPEEVHPECPLRRTKRRLLPKLLPLLFLFPSAGRSIEPLNPASIVARYLDATRNQAVHREDETMQITVDARVPRLHQRGILQALKFVPRSGTVMYRTQRYEGDRSVERSLIARYLSAEQQSSDSGSLAVTPENYRFIFQRVADYNGSPAYVFRLEPKHKRVGLFRGELWLDAVTCLPLREWGQLVKSPSIFIRRIWFVRDFIIVGGRSAPRRDIAQIDTRLVARAELTVWFDRVIFGELASAAAEPVLR